MAIYVTADLHFNHKGIIGFERSQFGTVEEHNSFIVSNWNKTVMRDDVVYVLGDVGFTPVDKIGEWTRKLNGHKYLVYGNHDRFTNTQARSLGFEKTFVGPIYFNDKIILCHEPAKEGFDNPYVIVIHGHLHNAKLSLNNFYNVNIARTGYKPMNMEVFKTTADARCKSRRDMFGEEWYKDYYVFDGRKDEHK